MFWQRLINMIWLTTNKNRWWTYIKAVLKDKSVKSKKLFTTIAPFAVHKNIPPLKLKVAQETVVLCKFSSIEPVSTSRSTSGWAHMKSLTVDDKFVAWARIFAHYWKTKDVIEMLFNCGHLWREVYDRSFWIFTLTSLILESVEGSPCRPPTST